MFAEEEKVLVDKQNAINNKVKFGAFVDTYYSYNNNRPKAKERNYTTQAIRNQEFNINLLHIEASVEEERYRGRIAMHWGTSVIANTAAEVQKDNSSNQVSTRNIQEAFVGVRLFKRTWLDAGVFFGNIGHESWISQNNVNYTRALALDYVPYYSSGVRLQHSVSDKLSFQVQILNGWQNITDNNKDKAFGSQIKYKFTPTLTLTLNQFVGNEAANFERKQYRFYNNTILEWNFFDQWSLAFQFDIGAQKAKESLSYEPWLSQINPSLPIYRSEEAKAYRQWYQGTIWLSYRINEDLRVALRAERMYDPLQVVASTNTRNGFITNGYTATLDILSFDPAMLRIEYVYRRSRDAIFDYQSRSSQKEDLVVFAFSMKF
ncbi:outer membrane protein [Leptospira ryugenii]|uniref:Outer membrane protein n=1 Tax=Leptospira ryugenii TaxID=1917863 RepID=A0A2P2E013_9LEPT|nr:outer membrane protein [Leptospira ryugenii]